MASTIIARDELRKLVKELPFQEIADTPTVKYYTDWKVYERLMDLDYADSTDTLPEHLANNVQQNPPSRWAPILLWVYYQKVLKPRSLTWRARQAWRV